MEFSRRGFLGLLLAGTAGLALPKDALWMPSPDLSLPPLTPEAIVGLEQATKAIARELAALVDGRLVAEVDGKIGKSGMTHQFAIELDSYPKELDQHGLDVERYIKPIADSFAKRITATKLDHFGMLANPNGQHQSAAAICGGVAVRGLRMFDLEWGSRVRFDVLCGRA